jgi:hypothetical protein
MPLARLNRHKDALILYLPHRDGLSELNCELGSARLFHPGTTPAALLGCSLASAYGVLWALRTRPLRAATSPGLRPQPKALIAWRCWRNARAR